MIMFDDLTCKWVPLLWGFVIRKKTPNEKRGWVNFICFSCCLVDFPTLSSIIDYWWFGLWEISEMRLPWPLSCYTLFWTIFGRDSRVYCLAGLVLICILQDKDCVCWCWRGSFSETKGTYKEAKGGWIKYPTKIHKCWKGKAIWGD